MGWNIRESLSPIPEEGEYVLRVESVELNVPEDSNKYPSVRFRMKVISPEVPENMVDQINFRTLNPKWLVFLARDIANANVIDIDGDNTLNPEDPAGMAEELDRVFSGKTFRYTLTHGTYNGSKSANWTLLGPTSSF
jgi:hypothetical protein